MDIAQKLRYQGRQYADGQFARGGGITKHWLEDAADELESLRAEVERLRAALTEARDDLVERIKRLDPVLTYSPWAEQRAQMVAQMDQYNKALRGGEAGKCAT